MKPVVEYRNYREYIQDYYDERKRCSAFTWREFAKVAGYASGSYLKLVCDGKTRLTEDGAKKTAAAMGLAGFDERYFVLMVNFENAKDEPSKKKFFEEMQALAAAHKVKILGSNFYTYYESWKHSVIRELAPAMRGASPLEMAKACVPAITAAEVRESLRFLVKSGLLRKDRFGHYHQTQKSVSTGPLDTVPVAVHSLVRQMGELALEALENEPISERHFSGLTLGVTSKSYARILHELAECRRRIVAIVADDPGTEKVCRLNMQLFPLAKNLNSKEGDEHE